MSNFANAGWMTAAAYDALTGGSCGLSDWSFDVAVVLARRYCRWHVAPERTETFVTGGDECGHLRIPSLETSQLVSLTGPSGAVSPASAKSFNHGVITRLGGFAGGPDSWTVEVVHGHPEAEAADFIQVVGAIARRIETAGQVQPGQVGQLIEEQIGQYRYKLDDSGAFGGDPAKLTTSEMALLDHYRIVLLP